MRFLLAIVSFVVAAVLIGFGIAQRTVFAPPDALETAVTTDGDAAFALITGETLASNAGNQEIRIEGDGPVFAAYGRTSDVLAWLGDEPRTVIAYDDEARDLTASVVEPDEAAPDPEPTEEPDDSGAAAGGTEDGATGEAPEPAAEAPNPSGSDLWLTEYAGEGSTGFTVRLPEDQSVIIASDGAAPAPERVAITWPLDQRTPLAGPLIVGGLVFLLLGIGFYIWALAHLRRSRRPRRKSNLPGGTGTRRRLVRRPRPAAKGADVRRAVVVVPVLVGALALSGCSPDFWPDVDAEAPAPTETPGAGDGDGADEELPPPAVRSQQLEGIVEDVSATVAQADTDRDKDLLATRMSGPAYDLRATNYDIRGADPAAAAPTAIPAAPVALVLPQQTNTWPRTVFTVLQDEESTETPAVGLMLVQETPRDNYRVEYQITLEPAASLPPVAPASIGAARLTVDNRLLQHAPQEIAPAYADVLLNGDASQYAGWFAAEGDSLRTQVGAEAKQQRRDSLPETATIDFSATAAEDVPIALATNDAGALVAVTVSETEVVRPVEEGATVTAEGAVRTLVGVDGSTRGITATYSEQILFYVPSSVDTDDTQIQMLGYSQGLVSAAEVPE